MVWRCLCFNQSWTVFIWLISLHQSATGSGQKLQDCNVRYGMTAPRCSCVITLESAMNFVVAMMSWWAVSVPVTSVVWIQAWATGLMAEKPVA